MRNDEGCGAINPYCSGTACSWSDSRGPAAEEGPSDRVSYRRFDPATDSTRVEAIRRALREVGYIEGQNLAIEYRYTEGKRDRYSELVVLSLLTCLWSSPPSSRW